MHHVYILNLHLDPVNTVKNVWVPWKLWNCPASCINFGCSGSCCEMTLVCFFVGLIGVSDEPRDVFDFPLHSGTVPLRGVIIRTFTPSFALRFHCSRRSWHASVNTWRLKIPNPPHS